MGPSTDAFTAALISRIEQAAPTRAPDAQMVAAAASAPPAAAEILRALSVREVVNVALGWRSVWDPGLGRFADSFDLAGIAQGHPGWFDPANSIELGQSAGGEVQFGVHWNGGVVEWVEVDSEEAIVTRFKDAEAFFRHVLADEQRRLEDRGDGRALPAPLSAIFAAAGSPLAAAPASAPIAAGQVAPRKGKALADPYATAKKHFNEKALLFESELTPAGRRVVVQRARHNPVRPLRVEVIEGDGSVRALEWSAGVDVYGVGRVPGRERVLFSTGVPGPLVEIDLETGTRRTLFEATLFGPSFVDERHLVVLSGDEVRVYAYGDGALGEPIAKLAMAGSNAFSAHGYVFVRGKHPNAGVFHVARWDGKTLEATADCATLNGKPYFWSAAQLVDGVLALCSVDPDGDASWYDYVRA